MLPLVISIPDLGMQLLKLLAVVGGVAVGAFGTGWLVQLSCRLTIQKQAPRPVLRVLRGLGGLTLGLAVALWVFGQAGTRGLGGGGGWWPFGGKAGHGDSAGTAADPTQEEKKFNDNKDRPKTGDVLRVVMLGGSRVTADRFYLIEGERKARTFEEIVKAIQEHQPPVKGIDIVIYLDSVAESHSGVSRLKQRAKELELTVDITKPGTEMPK